MSYRLAYVVVWILSLAAFVAALAIVGNNDELATIIVPMFVFMFLPRQWIARQLAR